MPIYKPSVKATIHHQFLKTYLTKKCVTPILNSLMNVPPTFCNFLYSMNAGKLDDDIPPPTTSDLGHSNDSKGRQNCDIHYCVVCNRVG